MAVSLTSRRRHYALGFWAVGLTYLTLGAFTTVPNPLCAGYQARECLSGFEVTVIYAAYAIGVIGAWPWPAIFPTGLGGGACSSLRRASRSGARSGSPPGGPRRACWWPRPDSAPS